MTEEIKQTLYKEYQIDIDTKFIQDLTFGSLLNWNSGNSKLSSAKSKETWTNDCDLYILPEHIITDLKVGNNKNNIFFLHPIEGNTNQMTSLALRLNANVYGLECTSECKFERIEDFAAFYGKVIREKQPEGPYILCGYSYGVLLVLEIASILETKGLSVRIICIDGSPEYSKCGFDELFNSVESFSNVHEKILIDFAMKHSLTDREKVIILLLNFKLILLINLFNSG